MYCPKCGATNGEDALFCTGCGSPLSNRAGFSGVTKSVTQTSMDEAGVGVILLSAIIPLIGLVLYFNWKKNFPKKSKTIMIAAGVGFALNLLYILLQ